MILTSVTLLHLTLIGRRHRRYKSRKNNWLAWQQNTCKLCSKSKSTSDRRNEFEWQNNLVMSLPFELRSKRKSAKVAANSIPWPLPSQVQCTRQDITAKQVNNWNEHMAVHIWMFVALDLSALLFSLMAHEKGVHVGGCNIWCAVS